MNLIKIFHAKYTITKFTANKLKRLMNTGQLCKPSFKKHRPLTDSVHFELNTEKISPLESWTIKKMRGCPDEKYCPALRIASHMFLYAYLVKQN